MNSQLIQASPLFLAPSQLPAITKTNSRSRKIYLVDGFTFATLYFTWHNPY